MNRKIRMIGTAVLVAIWAILVALVWLHPAQELSEAERRPLAQFPLVNGETLLSGKFMSGFEDYSVDQFPGRDAFRTLKSLFHTYVMQQKDNNGIYVADGYAVKLEYPLQPDSISHATKRFNRVYEKYLQNTDSCIYTAVIPDKGYYLAEEKGYLAPDYDKLFAQVQQQMPWATYVDITDCLAAEDYYFTDTHWRQEGLIPTAKKLAAAMGVTVEEDYRKTELSRPFYGVYYGQAALPMKPEAMYILESDLLDGCRVFDFETQSYTPVYNLEKLDGKDLYEVFLSGSKSLLRIENPNAGTDRELIVFRDSFGSSLTPLLVKDYQTVTLVDIRYISSELLDRYLEFNGQDVLFLYSTLVLNNGTTIK